MFFGACNSSVGNKAFVYNTASADLHIKQAVLQGDYNG